VTTFSYSCAELAPGIVHLKLVGPLDWQACARLDAELNALFDRGVNRLAIELRQAGFATSAAFGLLIYAHDVTTKRKGALVIVAPPPSIADTLKMLGLNQIFAFCDTVEDAKRILSQV